MSHLPQGDPGRFFFFLVHLFILNKHWLTPVFFVYPALHLDSLGVISLIIIQTNSSIIYVAEVSIYNLIPESCGVSKFNGNK